MVVGRLSLSTRDSQARSRFEGGKKKKIESQLLSLPLSLSLSLQFQIKSSPVHEERLEDPLGVVERPVGQRHLLDLGLGRDAPRRRGASSPPAAARRDGPGVDDFREEVDQSVDQSGSKVLPEEDGRVANLRAQVLER